MPKRISKGEIIKIDLNLKFKGLITGYIVEVENQHVITENNQAKDFPIVFNGKPISIRGNFVGAKDAVVEEFEVTINNHTAKNNNLSLNKGGLEIKDYKPLIFFDLEEI